MAAAMQASQLCVIMNTLLTCTRDLLHQVMLLALCLFFTC